MVPVLELLSLWERGWGEGTCGARYPSLGQDLDVSLRPHPHLPVGPLSPAETTYGSPEGEGFTPEHYATATDCLSAARRAASFAIATNAPRKNPNKIPIPHVNTGLGNARLSGT